MDICTWAPTTFSGANILVGDVSHRDAPTGDNLANMVRGYVGHLENIGISHLLIAQRWWGNAAEIEASSLDCLAMTAWIAAHTQSLKLITAIHPGFFDPAVIAKWGATLNHITTDRWAINVTTGWNLEEFSMYGVDAMDHDGRYERSKEFIEVLKGAWQQSPFTHQGKYYKTENLILEPKPTSDLTIYQGGQSPAAMDMAIHHSDTMFLNGGSLTKIAGIIETVTDLANAEGGKVPDFAVYGIPVCRATDAEAQAVIDDMISRVDPALLAARKQRTSGATGMWSSDEAISMLDTNEGYATGLIGSPDTILSQLEKLKSLGVTMMHLHLADPLFVDAVLPAVKNL